MRGLSAHAARLVAGVAHHAADVDHAARRDPVDAAQRAQLIGWRLRRLDDPLGLEHLAQRRRQAGPVELHQHRLIGGSELQQRDRIPLAPLERRPGFGVEAQDAGAVERCERRRHRFRRVGDLDAAGKPAERQRRDLRLVERPGRRPATLHRAHRPETGAARRRRSGRRPAECRLAGRRGRRNRAPAARSACAARRAACLAAPPASPRSPG